MAKITAICSSKNRGERKKNQSKGVLVAHFGLQGDAHAGYGQPRQVSLLAEESIAKVKRPDLEAGDFAENIITQGIELFSLPIGIRMRLGKEALGEVSQIGKICHDHCAIYEQTDDCIMPREGIFIRVIKGGEIKVGDELELVDVLTAAVLTVSDKGSRGEREDISGPLIGDVFKAFGGEVLDTAIVADNQEAIEAQLIKWSDEHRVDVIFTTGGAGFAPRDVTPEATLAVIERQAPGFAEAMRAVSLRQTPHAMLSRAVSGIRKQTIIINLPGSPRAARESLQVILPALRHGSQVLHGRVSDCAKL